MSKQNTKNELSTQHSALSTEDYTYQLRQFMQRVGVSSFKQLSREAGVSEWQVTQLRQGRVKQMRVEPLLKMSQALQVPVSELLATFGKIDTGGEAPAAIKEEYQRLQAQLEQQRESLMQEFQHSSLQVLESWLLQWPTAAHAAQQNPQIPASRLLPLLKPMEHLLNQWGVEAIASVGEEIPYDPQWHQLMEGTAGAGDIVKVRYTGYRQGDKLLYRAKVSPISQANNA
jgi:molecular chaperone GrpE (heat shock protein)